MTRSDAVHIIERYGVSLAEMDLEADQIVNLVRSIDYGEGQGLTDAEEDELYRAIDVLQESDR
jgi:hypothetical protein